MSGRGGRYYPVFLDLEGRKSLVVGGGKVSERKVRPLLKSGSDVTVISPDITEWIKRMAEQGRLKHKGRRFRKGDAKGYFLVVAATSDENVNKRVYEDAEGLINSVDMPELCNFIVPSVISKGPLQIAISSSGLSPAVSRTLREDLEKHVHDDIPKYLNWLRDIRTGIKERIPGMSRDDIAKRTRILKKLGSKEVIGDIRTKGFDKVRRYVEKMIEKDWES